MGTASYIQEAHIPDTFRSFNSYQLETVMFQMKNCICKIKVSDNKIGTGFFCKIPFPDTFSLLPVLITCNHVLDKYNISQGKTINFSLENDKEFHSITIDNSRRTYTSEEKDVTIIEIRTKADKIEEKSFFEIDKEINHDKPPYIYITHYEKGDEAKYSIGKILKIEKDQFNIEHNCSTQTGSSGSPIININNYKVIGVHKGFDKLNLGTLLKIPIDEFNQLYKNVNISKNENNRKNREDRENRENNLLSVIIEDENQNSYSLICKKTDYFSSLEKKLFKKEPSLKNKYHYYIINNEKIDISKTIEQNNITDSSTIYYKIGESEEENNKDDEKISVIIKSSSQDFKASFICKGSDKFKVLVQDLYKKIPELKNKLLYYLYNGDMIDVEKTIKENNIKDSAIIIYNIYEFFDHEI